MAKKEEKDEKVEQPADPNQWDTFDKKQQKDHNMFRSLSQAFADAFEDL